jgi:hypothetical protein
MKAMKKELQSVAKALKSLTTKTERMSKRIDKLAKAQAQKKAKARPKPKPKKKARVKARPVKRKVARKKAARKVAKKKAPARKKAKVSGSDAVFKIIKRSNKGVGTAVLKQKTGFKEKKIRDTIYRLKKQRKIKSVQKGFYVAI